MKIKNSPELIAIGALLAATTALTAHAAGTIAYDDALATPAPAYTPQDTEKAPAAASTAPNKLLAQSREELFGLPPAGKPPAEKPAAGEPLLVKPAPERGFALNGFYDFELAYTYPKTAHWSRAVNRFQLEASGRIGGNKWKLGGRADIDPVYYGSNYYLDGVKNDQKLDFFWRENYIDFGAGDLAFRIGAQNIVWGEVVGLFFADVVSARDQREFILPSFDIIRIPQGATSLRYLSESPVTYT